MMHPPRHIRGDAAAVDLPFRFACLGVHQGEALGVGDDLARVERLLDVVDGRPQCPRVRSVGPLSNFAAATRSSFCADRQRAKTASAIRVRGTPRSAAEITVHFPVPFCPAASRIRSTIGFPVSGSVKPRISRVISIR